MADSSVYSLYGVSELQQSTDRSLLGSTFRVLRWTLGLCVLVLIVDFIFVLFIWQDGTNELARLVESERANMGLPSDRLPGAFVDTVVSTAHDWVFVKTGLTDWISNSQGGILTAFITWCWILIETAYLGLQLFAGRLAVLVLSMPLFLAVGAVAISDGLFGWLQRRTVAGRESGFIYHRAKRAFPVFVVVLWLVYLVPPVEMDPRWIIPPFVVLFAIALRLRVSFFKKYV
ncbi:MAG: DUF4400 domain-containing protein [Pseudomonadota bacterium]